MPGNTEKAPLENANAPDTARVYERAKPELESGMGRLDNNQATPVRQPDRMPDAVSHAQETRQINSQEERPAAQRSQVRK